LDPDSELVHRNSTHKEAGGLDFGHTHALNSLSRELQNSKKFKKEKIEDFFGLSADPGIEKTQQNQKKGSSLDHLLIHQQP